MKQMFDISEKLIVGQSDEICGVTPIDWEDSSWKQLSLVNDKEVISLSHAKVYVFSDSVPRLGKVNQNPTSNTVWEEKLSWFWTQLMVSLWNSSGNKVQEFMIKMGDPSQFKGRIIFTSMFNDISW